MLITCHKLLLNLVKLLVDQKSSQIVGIGPVVLMTIMSSPNLVCNNFPQYINLKLYISNRIISANFSQFPQQII
jgi:hypothetical protein